MDILVLTTIVASLFLVIGLSEPLAARLRLPFSVILAGMGILIGLGAAFFLRTNITDALNPVAEGVLALPIRSNVFLYVFLPTLLFQATLGLNMRRMADDWMPILLLAVIAVLVATVVIGFSLSAVSALPIAACLLIGAIVSTTDPSAVVGIFRNITAPQRLTRIIEGESLLNDAAAIALFGLFVGFVMSGVPDPSLSRALTGFPWLVAGGLLTGWLAAQLAVRLMVLVNRHELAQISISVALPYLAYIASEQLLAASGVIAVVTTGLTLNLIGPGRLAPVTWTALREVWDLLAHWSGSFIFVLAALLIPRLLHDVRWFDIFLTLVVIVAAITARAMVLFLLMPVLERLRLSPRIETPFRIAILWGGLRGAVTLVLALAVTESAHIPDEIKRVVGILATGFTLFTLIVQGSTLRWIISRLGLDKLSPVDTALSEQVIAVALQNVREDVATATSRYDLTHETVRTEAKLFGQRLEEAIHRAEDTTRIGPRDRITLGLIALAGRERMLILDQFHEQTVSRRLADRSLSNADRLIEATRSDGRSGYRRAARRNLGFGRGFRLAIRLHNILGISAPLARMTANRFEMLLTQRLILRDLHGFIDNKTRRIHGRRVAELLHGLLRAREQENERTLEGLRLQYPGYAEELERRFIRRTALRLEAREYTILHEDGLISPELYATLMRQVEAAHGEISGRPKLDLAVQKIELVSRFPLFQALDKKTRKRLVRALNTRYAEPGEILFGRENSSKSVYFIASGAVEITTANQKHRLGRGEMFGQLALLMKGHKRSEVVAISHCTLLELGEARFLRLLKRNTSLRDAVEHSAVKRGVVLKLPDTGRNLRDAPAPAAQLTPADGDEEAS